MFEIFPKVKMGGQLWIMSFFIISLLLSLGVFGEIINKTNNFEESTPAEGLGAEQFVKYVEAIKKCVNSTSKREAHPTALLKANTFCLKDSRALQSFDCFVGCIDEQLGSFYEKRVGDNVYLADNFNALMPILNEVYGSSSASNWLVSTVSRCKPLMPDAPFFPVLDKCHRLNGVYTCCFINFLKEFDCEMDDEQRELLAVYDLDRLGNFENFTN